MARAAKAGNIQVITNFTTTFYPNDTALYRYLHDGTLGDARKIVVHDGHNSPRPTTGPYGWLADEKLNGGGALFDFGCYGANLSTWMMDGHRPTSVTCVIQTMNPEVYTRVDDEATIVMTYPKCQAILQASWNWPFNRKDIEIYGESGYAISYRSDMVRLRKKGEWEQVVPVRNLSSPNDDSLHYLRAVVDGLKPSGPSSLEYNLVATEILDAARESGKTGKTLELPAKAPWTDMR
jgi:predicted dehydrogenase